MDIALNISPDEFLNLQNGISAKDVEIARLKEQVAQLEEERDLWRTRALNSDVTQKNVMTNKNCFVVLSMQRLKSVLEKIQDVKILSLVSFILQKALPQDATAEECKAIAEMMPVPHKPSLSLTANGDVKVAGNYNDVHDNKAVNF